MYDYKMVKSIHDQRMRQFMIEAERGHLLRLLRNRSVRNGLIQHAGQRLREGFQAVAAGLRVKRLPA